MSLLAIGPFMVRSDWLSFILAVVISYFTLYLFMRRTDYRTAILDSCINGLVIGLLSWKLSLVIFEPTTTLKNPLSLLYFDGGLKGIWLGIILAGLYLFRNVMRNRKLLKPLIEAIALGYFTLMFGLKLFLIVFSENVGSESAGSVILYGLLAAFTWGWIRQAAVWKAWFSANKVNTLVLLVVVGLGFWTVLDRIADRETASPEIGQEGITAPVGLKIGEQAPNFELQRLDGAHARLSDYLGQTVFLNFWATWCPPCQVELPHLQAFHVEFIGREQAGVVLGVNLTHTEKNSSVVASFAAEHKLTFPIINDTDGAVTDLYKVRGYPTTYVIDATGVIRNKFQGPIDYEKMETAYRKAQ